MSIKERIEEALHQAIRSGDTVKKRALRITLSSIKLEEVQKGAPLEEIEIVSVLQKEIKMRRESIQDAKIANRDDLIESNQAEIAVIETFLPAQLSDDALRALAESAIAEIQAQGMGDVGKVMKVLLPRIQGRAPNDRVSLVVRQLLSGS